ncbi:MAG: FAD-dependent oxidoreductase, partial [Anaerolineae bacterium]|nr:FAD-dependent oxidoreductase [Anaerolineae bacterium]
MEKRVIVIGAGFAGLRAVRGLADKGFTVTLVDRQNYHLFQPLLYQVATAGLESESIAYPVRAALRGLRDVAFRMGEVTRVDLDTRMVSLSSGDSLPYDYLVIAAGAATMFFGLESVEHVALELKDLDDATRLRNRVLTAFEQAAHEQNPDIRRALLTFIVAGGGPTGIEFAGALTELIRQVLVRDYPEVRREDVRVLLVE